MRNAAPAFREGDSVIAALSQQAAVAESVPRPRTRLRRLRITPFLFIIGLGGYLVFVWVIGWRDVRDTLLAADIRLVVLATAVITAGTWLRIYKWRYALGRGHDVIGIYFISKLGGNWSPGRLGEFAPLALKRHRTPKVGAWLLLDRVLEIVVTLILGSVGLAAITFATQLELQSVATLIGVVIGIVAGGIGAYALLTRKGPFLWAAERLQMNSRLHRLMKWCAEASERMAGFARALPVALLITLVTKCADLWAVCLVFFSIGEHVDFFLMAAAKCALAIVSFLPFTPTPTGAPHLTQAWIMNEAGGIPAEALIAGIGVEVAVVSVSFWTCFGFALPYIRRAAV